MRLLSAVLLLVLLGACGVERESAYELDEDVDVTVATETEAPEDAVTIPEQAAPPVTSPPTTAPAADIALTATFSDGTVEITHGELNELAYTARNNDTFLTLLPGGVAPAGFEQTILGDMLIKAAIELEVAERGAQVTPEQVQEATDALSSQLTDGAFAAEADPAATTQALFDNVPYLPFVSEFGAAQTAFLDLVVEGADPGDGLPCASHFLVATEAEALAGLERVNGGEEFAAVAAELSTDPGSAINGGELGCADPAGYVLEFKEAIESAELNVPVGPVETQFGFHVLVVTDYQVDGPTSASAELQDRFATAEVAVDDRIGQWDPALLSIVPTTP